MTIPTILCVDDEEEVLQALQRVFLDDPYRLLTARSGPAALELLAREPVAAIISDYLMPEMTGTEFLSRAHAQHPGAVGILLSGYVEASAISELIEDGTIFAFVAKPWQDDELRLVVQRALASR